MCLSRSDVIMICGDGSSMAIMLDHRSTALGRDLNSQVRAKAQGISDSSIFVPKSHVTPMF